ncbi:MAG: hypothetical protein COS49_01710 [Candidatus Portnoybacteria bacterium CG03_land_8_20_14_0_80_41_10]|uniref:Uncharacterized protein n=1 Tax=Candidatus Portnoybacteria bacterium CG03_land_8_20_14_0_80_41_10 TaxID=1974808 RepID=A0A2M7BUH8_9BACT|nr:MAG: hypothetical protein COS49_01710 [Candidatus Portnoybacteria bacterium CG03_land_8_20_14_0_80_41_10]
MAIPVPKIFVIIQGLRTLSALIPMNWKELAVEFVRNVTEMAIVLIEQMVIIPANVGLVVKDVFMVLAGIIT